MAGEWIEVDPSEVNDCANEMEFNVFVSPYDVPEAVRGSYDKARGKFVIDFRYISGDEPVKLQSEENHVSFFSGVRSDRLRRIEIDTEAIDVGQVSVNICTAIERLRSPGGHNRIQNYATIGRLVNQKRKSLFSSLSH